jgi:hypothetical protein
MATNLLKIYNEFLEIVHLSEPERKKSLKDIFNRDISNNQDFAFRRKVIRPLKIDGQESMDTLFSHLTCESKEVKDEKGRKYKQRIFDIDRSKRLHWIWHHIQEKDKDKIDVFSYQDRVNGKNKIRTYIYDFVEKYVLILEPQRSQTDYYLLTAYYLTKEKGGIRQIEKKREKRLDKVY